jgi:5-methylcytosine-specific restriction protein A
VATTGSRLKQLGPRIAPLPARITRAPEVEPTTRANAPWRNWYSLARWKRLRMETFTRDRFTCAMCGQLQGDTSKLVADHIKPHRGNATLFWDRGNIQTLCAAPCHAKRKQAEEHQTLHHRGVWD